MDESKMLENSAPEDHELSAGQKKVREYINRINDGESLVDITSGLPETFTKAIEDEIFSDVNLEIPPQYSGLRSDVVAEVWIVPEYTDPDVTRKENWRREKVLQMMQEKEGGVELKEKIEAQDKEDEQRITEIMNKITESKEGDVVEVPNTLRRMISELSLERSEGVQNLYKTLQEDYKNSESRETLYKALITDQYMSYRSADYADQEKEQKIWDSAKEDLTVEHSIQNGWMYRGLVAGGESAKERGSLNVTVTDGLIRDLDNLISEGGIRMNYKFGEPGTQASPGSRHDSITMYFYDKLTTDQLEKISHISQKHGRGEKLLGKRINESFYMSEIGNIQSEHIDSFLDTLGNKDFSDVIRKYCTKKNILKMSEAQFYAIKDVGEALGYDISYNNQSGFTVGSL